MPAKHPPCPDVAHETLRAIWPTITAADIVVYIDQLETRIDELERLAQITGMAMLGYQETT